MAASGAVSQRGVFSKFVITYRLAGGARGRLLGQHLCPAQSHRPHPAPAAVLHLCVSASEGAGAGEGEGDGEIEIEIELDG